MRVIHCLWPPNLIIFASVITNNEDEWVLCKQRNPIRFPLDN